MVASIEQKPWTPLDKAAIDALPAQLGVYEIADGGQQFRLEFTHGYLTRSQELLMRFQARTGELPPGNHEQIGKLGRLSPLE